MSTLTVQLPEFLHLRLQALAVQEGCSVDQFLAIAVAEKLSALDTLDFLRREASKAGRQDFESFLAAVPRGPVPETDRLPDEPRRNA